MTGEERAVLEAAQKIVVALDTGSDSMAEAAAIQVETGIDYLLAQPHLLAEEPDE